MRMWIDGPVLWRPGKSRRLARECVIMEHSLCAASARANDLHFHAKRRCCAKKDLRLLADSLFTLLWCRENSAREDEYARVFANETEV